MNFKSDLLSHGIDWMESEPHLQAPLTETEFPGMKNLISVTSFKKGQEQGKEHTQKDTLKSQSVSALHV